MGHSGAQDCLATRQDHLALPARQHSNQGARTSICTVQQIEFQKRTDNDSSEAINPQKTVEHGGRPPSGRGRGRCSSYKSVDYSKNNQSPCQYDRSKPYASN